MASTLDDRLGKHEVFTQIVGRAPFGGQFSGDVPEFEIKPEDKDKVYSLVKRMQKCYSDKPATYPVKVYYSGRFTEIDQAFVSNDPKVFKEAVRGLMVAIDCE
ncbi:MAG: hypothetical protein WCI72_00335 [archaeon]